MLALFKKEVSYFFSSLIGITVLVIFFLLQGIFLWMVPISEYLHIPSSGYASLEPLFTLAPWMYLFLIPAITMRTFSEEKTTGTLELLLTKPISEFQIVSAKYLACMVILILSLLPTLVYYFSISSLAFPAGNVDSGATLGSYLGLLLLGSIFTSIGIFASALSNNQIISLLLGVVLCITFYLGFTWVSSFGLNNELGFWIKQIGIQEHYYSISRGLIESKDIFYYCGATIVFLFATELKIKSRNW
jgi:ABC-2 type transport system permease protein